MVERMIVELIEMLAADEELTDEEKLEVREKLDEAVHRIENSPNISVLRRTVIKEMNK